MTKRRQRRWGLLLALVLAVLALGAIALLVVRPARVIGVSEASITDSVADEAGAPFRCAEVPGGRPGETVWRCTAGEDEPPIAVQADDWGCWESQRIGRDGGRHSGCIWIRDYVHVLD